MIVAENLKWEPIPDGMCDKAQDFYEIAAPFYVRRKSSKGGRGALLTPYMSNSTNQGKARYSLFMDSVQAYLQVQTVMQHFGHDEKPNYTWRKVAAQDIKEFNSDAVVKRKLRVNPWKMFQSGASIKPDCPWDKGLIRGEAMGADPVLGF